MLVKDSVLDLIYSQLPLCIIGQFRVNTTKPDTAYLIRITKSLFVKYCNRGSEDRTCL